MLGRAIAPAVASADWYESILHPCLPYSYLDNSARIDATCRVSFSKSSCARELLKMLYRTPPGGIAFAKATRLSPGFIGALAKSQPFRERGPFRLTVDTVGVDSLASTAIGG